MFESRVARFFVVKQTKMGKIYQNASIKIPHSLKIYKMAITNKWP
jgi:hypothetical protein